MRSSACIVVADRRRARFFILEGGGRPQDPVALAQRAELDSPALPAGVPGGSGAPRTETNTDRESGPVHPVVVQRARHELEIERRFAREIADVAQRLTREWQRGMVVLVAEPRLLGLLRGPLSGALGQGVELKELAKDYAHFSAAELHGRLARDGLLSRSPRPGE